jgi:2-oxoglutarate ferredoxin oxidoreductase subunit alpha
MRRNDLVIRIAGESGEGVVSTGDLVTQAAARAGFEVLTFKTFPAEIKGGHVIFQLRLSDEPLTAPGDTIDILLAFNQEAYDTSYGLLRDNGLLIYDSGAFNPPADERCRHKAVPLTEIAKTQLKFELGKNVVAVGVVAAMFGLDLGVIQRLLQDRFGRKGEEILNKNLRALQAGIDYVETHIEDRREFRLEAGAQVPGAIVVSGNQALSLGAMAAGLDCFFGYPITPASEVMEFLAAELPKTGGLALQAEDEMSAMGMVLGASYAGKKAMTASAGPGISLMTEMLGLAAMAELPCVIVDVQRAGPSTGMPTKQAATARCSGWCWRRPAWRIASTRRSMPSTSPSVIRSPSSCSPIPPWRPAPSASRARISRRSKSGSGSASSRPTKSRPAATATGATG